jgi:CheY-like chemotaxis protein
VVANPSRRVLAVEDDDDLREALCFLLKELGYEVRECANGRDGLETATHWRPDVVLLDLGLPDMDGYEVASALRALGIETLKIIALTGSDPSDTALPALFAGYIVKPFDAEDLRRKLQETAGVG